MSALSYICDYGDDEDSLTDESDKEDTKNIKRLKLPTPNLSGVSVVALEDNHIDDPSLHNGCTRAFPHVRGNWATFTYIEYPNEKRDDLLTIIEKLESILPSVKEPWIVNEIAHISLSRTFVLRYHMIKSFTTSLESVLSNCERFYLNFDSFQVYCNEERTRTFLALKVDAASHRYLCHIIKKINSVLNEYRLPIFYEDPSFHMSILSVTGNERDKFLKILHKLNEILAEQNNTVLKPININKINCKSGNKTYQYYLK